VDNRRSKEAMAVLGNLLDEKPEIAGAAHSLMARILWESESPNAEKLQETETHRQKAEALLPETAEAYFLQAMGALTIKEQLGALDKALQLDPAHYESRRLRAYTYYASRTYGKLKDDALGMTILRPRDPLGYSLRAAAWRELGGYPEALEDYDTVLALTPENDPSYLALASERSETLLRMGDYQRVVTETPGRLKRAPDQVVFRYHLFCALTALGDYEQAGMVFAEIVGRTPTARNEFQYWSMKYVFDTLASGRSWHRPGQEPEGPAFLAMMEAQEVRDRLCARGRRLTTDGFSAHWSGDGKKLAFSLGVQGRSGVAVFDPATNQTDLLIVPGKDPRWSPDGKYIAFVRDCPTLRLEEFARPERKNANRPVKDEELWLMKADGTEPRRLAAGGWPSWSQDSRAVYFRSHGDQKLCSISITGTDAQPKQIVAASTNAWPSVSPDGRRVACLERAALKVKDLTSQKIVAEWPVPCPVGWGGASWSPQGDELCMGGNNVSSDRTALWVYRLDRPQPAKVLSGQITFASWSPDRTKLVYTLGAPYFEIWTADLDPKVSTVEALGSGRTLEEHYREVVDLYTRRIGVDPQDAYAHSSRAQYYDYLHEREKAQADMRQFSVILGGKTSSDSRNATPRRLRGAIDGPFGYQLAFSVGGRANGIPVLCVAFGQKGRCEMKAFEIPMLAMSLLGFGLLSGLDAPPAHANFAFGKTVKIEWPDTDSILFFSYDGLEVYGESIKPGGYGSGDLYVRRRASINDDWGAPENLGPQVNTSSAESMPSTSGDGLTLYFNSNRPGGYGSWDTYVTTRATKESPWGKAVNAGPKINTSSVDGEPWITQDGRELYFISYRPGGYGGSDIYVARRASLNDPWGDPVNLGPAVNSPYEEQMFSLSPDGLLLLFADTYNESDTPRPGGYGRGDLWMTRRATLSEPWQPAVNLGPMVNGPLRDCGRALISPDGGTLYFWNESAGMDGYWLAPITPIVDFNGDGKVDLVDLVMLIDNWGTNKTPCDIGPYAWGDGKVDIEDLKVFMTYYEKENPPAKP
ncbi:MAG: hypothetical protein FJ280_18570, partial [Planctomycetes bacterium]|nr:hypothetical protein [Planctomycetota bacterium]